MNNGDNKRELSKLYVDGSRIIDMCYEALFNENYEEAKRILQIVENLSYVQIENILKGEKTLHGIENIIYTDSSEEQKDLLQQFYLRQYGKLIQFDNKLYEPYALVDSWCEHDLPDHTANFSQSSYDAVKKYNLDIYQKMFSLNLQDSLNSHPHSRSLFYADNPKQDIAISICAKNISEKYHIKKKSWKSDHVVLFKLYTGKHPLPEYVTHFFAKSPEQAVANYMNSKNTLLTYGAESLYYDSPQLAIQTDYFTLPLSAVHKNSIILEDSTYKSENNSFNGSFFQSLTEEKDSYFDHYEQQIEQYKQRVINFANEDKEYGWKELISPDNPEHRMKVPYRAFLHFCVNRATFSEIRLENKIELPPYTAFFPQNVKAANDNPYHTDCWLGAGMRLETAYDTTCWQYKLLYSEMQKCQSLYMKTNMEFAILNNARKSKFAGTTVNIHNYDSVPKGKRLLVLPHLGVEFETAALQCDAIITESGGKLAHLVTVGRELGIPIVRVDDAPIRFALPHTLEFDLEQGKIIDLKNSLEKIQKIEHPRLSR